ncbi:MAG TPA: peptidoglycan DD-metalloendopeptidase family protein [Flavisolibacter sp.]
MKKIFGLLLLSFVYTILLNAQQVREPDGGGNYQALHRLEDELTPQQRQQIIQELQANEKQLCSNGKLAPANKTAVVGFYWPIVQSPGFNDKGFYGISNYVDHNQNYPQQVLDYQCGNRSYDLSSGYNHKGIDIATWPFPWKKMQQNAVQVVASAPETIIAKHDGNSDQNCAFCSSGCFWNAVYVMHADGSVAWYGHMKANSLTAKSVGQPVATGEYLGIVGSSGNSTGPHLHLEVYTDNTYTQLIDPYAGPCNSFNGSTSWWASQQPYNVSTLLKAMTHGAPPALGGCAGAEAENGKINFVNGERVYLGSYYRDQQTGQQAVHTVYHHNHTVYSTWTQNFNNNFSSSWWYYSFNLPPAAQTGMWRYEIVYNGQSPVNTFFAVNTTGYSFIGNGNWNMATNWANEALPPAVLPAGNHIIINPVEGGECVLTTPQTIIAGAVLRVYNGKTLRTTNMIIQ